MTYADIYLQSADACQYKLSASCCNLHLDIGIASITHLYAVHCCVFCMALHNVE